MSAAAVVPAVRDDAPGGRTASRARRRRRLPRPGGIVAFIFGTVWLCVVLFPVYYMVLASFRSQPAYLSANPWVPNGGFSLSSWAQLFRGTSMATYLLNSVLYTAGTIVVVVVVSLMAAFRIVRGQTRLGPVAFRLILLGLAVSIYAVLIPLYAITSELHLYDTVLGLILVTSAASISLAVLLTVNYVRLIPAELFDAMAVDGASELEVFTKLVFPMARPVVGVVAIWAGIGAWNNFVLPLILTQSTGSTVLPLGIFSIYTTNSGYGVNVPIVMAGCLFSLLPLLLLYLALRRQFVRGLGAFALR